MRRGVKEVDPKTLVTNERGGERGLQGHGLSRARENGTCASAEGDDRGSMLILAGQASHSELKCVPSESRCERGNTTALNWRSAWATGRYWMPSSLHPASSPSVVVVSC